MDSRLEIRDKPRDGTSPALASAPLSTIAWRVLKTQSRRTTTERAGHASQISAAVDSVVGAYDEVFRWRKGLRVKVPVTDPDQTDHQNADLLQRIGGIEKALASSGVSALAPDGEVYTLERMEIIENVAQVPTPGISEPRILEMLVPAIQRDGHIVRMGKAVIAVPLQEASGCQSAGGGIADFVDGKPEREKGQQGEA